MQVKTHVGKQQNIREKGKEDFGIQMSDSVPGFSYRLLKVKQNKRNERQIKKILRMVLSNAL